MMKSFITISKFVFSFLLISFFLYQVFNFQEFYFKFASSPGINEHGLEKSFYMLLLCEFGLAVLVWMKKPAFLHIVSDILSLIYFPFLIILLWKINDITGGCIPCHISMFEPLGLNYHIILALLVLLMMVYLLIRNSRS